LDNRLIGGGESKARESVALFTAAGNIEIQQAKEVSRGRCGRRAPGRRRALDLMLGQSGDVVEWWGGSGLGSAIVTP
jgi:hypothetical protein